MPSTPFESAVDINQSSTLVNLPHDHEHRHGFDCGRFHVSFFKQILPNFEQDIHAWPMVIILIFLSVTRCIMSTTGIVIHTGF